MSQRRDIECGAKRTISLHRLIILCKQYYLLLVYNYIRIIKFRYKINLENSKIDDSEKNKA